MALPDPMINLQDLTHTTRAAPRTEIQRYFDAKVCSVSSTSAGVLRRSMQSVNSVRTGVMGRELSCAVDATDRSRARSDPSEPGASLNAPVSGQIWTFAVVRPQRMNEYRANRQLSGAPKRAAPQERHRAGSWPPLRSDVARRVGEAEGGGPDAWLSNNTSNNPRSMSPR
jgi:hypothetical protein